MPKQFTLNQEQFNLLAELAVEERHAIRSSFHDVSYEERVEMIDRYNNLAEIFNLEEWSENRE